jgi:hypothetical protein
MLKVERVGKTESIAVERVALTHVPDSTGFAFSKLVCAALCNAAGELVVQIWALATDGTAQLASQRVEGGASEVAVCAAGALRVVVAVRDSQGNLRLISYTTSENGTALKRRGLLISTKITRVVIDSATSNSVTVARHQPDRRVRISTWTLNDAGEFRNEKPAPLGDGKVRQIDLAAGQVEFALTAVTDGEAHRVRHFNGPDFAGGAGTGLDAKAVTIANADAGRYWTASMSAGSVGIRTGPLGGGRLVLADAGMLSIALWETGPLPSTDELTLLAQGGMKKGSMTGLAWEMDLIADAGGLCFLVTRGEDTYKKLLQKDRGKPKLRLFVLDAKEGKVRRIGQGNLTGMHTQPAMARAFFPGASTTHSARVCTATRSSKGLLEIVVWDITE